MAYVTLVNKVLNNCISIHNHMLLFLRWVKFIPIAPWSTLWWLHWVVILETALFFGRMAGWFSSIVRFDFLNAPPAHYMLQLSRNESKWLVLLFSGAIVFFDFSCLICLISESSLCQWYYLAVSKLFLFNQNLLITTISVIILFIFIQLMVISCSLDNTELFWMLETLTIITSLSSESLSDTSSYWCSSNQHCILPHKKEGSSNYFFIWSLFLELNPREAWITATFNVMLLIGNCIVFY